MNEQEFVKVAIATAERINPADFNLNYCCYADRCGCIMHHMFATKAIAVPETWSVLTADRLLQNYSQELRNILGFGYNDEFYEEDIEQVELDEVISQLKAYYRSRYL